MSAIKVLFIEDNPQHIKVVSRYLSKDPRVKLTYSQNLLEGLQKINNENISVVLLDLGLPDDSGYGVLLRTVASAGKVPVIVLSSQENREFAKELIHQGAQDYICKTELTEDLLIRTINSAIERKKIDIKLRLDNELRQCLNQIGKIGLSNKKYEQIVSEILDIIKVKLAANAIVLYEVNGEEEKFNVKYSLGFMHSQPQCMTEEELITPIEKSKFYFENRFAAGVSAYLEGEDEERKYGVLVVLNKEHREYLREEKYFLNSAADILTSAYQRNKLLLGLRKKINELNDEHRKKDVFLSVLSHELRTPLSVLSNSIELLKTFPPGGQRYADILDLIERNVLQEVKLVDDILDTSRIITGQMRVVSSQFFLNEVIDMAIQTVEYSAHAKGIKIEKLIQPEIICCWGDCDRLLQVLWNLLTNAVKFTDSGGHIFLEAFSLKESIVIRVKDSGIGISPANISHVFERFWQVDGSTTRANQGMGLGLSISKQIIEAHGGSLNCYSEGMSKGSTFEISIPIINQGEPAARYSEVKSRVELSKTKNDVETVETVENKLKNIRIMLVEDSLDGQQIYKYYLESAGATVKCFDLALPALERYTQASNEYDVIVSDIGLPGMDGYEFIERIRAHESKLANKIRVPALVLTAYAKDTDAEKALASGFDFYLKKPVKLNQLVNKISDMTLVNKHT